MKIKSINFIKHPVFNNHMVTFGDTSIPQISFLVGNNGSGKTQILDTIYSLFTDPGVISADFDIEIFAILTATEQSELSLPQNEIIYKVNRSESGGLQTSLKYTGVELHNKHLIPIAKVIFSIVEVNFSQKKIGSVTSKNIDDILKPTERSQNLAEEIPQLLIDIKNLDDAEQGNWYRGVRGTIVPTEIPANIGTRLDRFTTAFHRIFAGTKSFHDIRNIADSKRIIFTDANGVEVELNNLSTGEKQIIYRIGYILKNLANLQGSIILIDEPEISLHPIWQLKLKDFLLEVFSAYDIQLIIATHSPYIFHHLQEPNEVCIKVDRTVAESKKIFLIFPRVPYNPSVNLINYLAYGIVSELLHIELYTLLQIKESKESVKDMETWLRDPAGANVSIRQTFNKTGKPFPTNESIMTWIRNKIHHPDEAARPNFSREELKESIDEMITILKRP